MFQSRKLTLVLRFQVSPSELENVLCGSDEIADAAVTSIYNAEQATELPRAYVVPKDPRLLEACAPGKTEITPGLKALSEHIKGLTEKKLIRYKW